MNTIVKTITETGTELVGKALTGDVLGKLPLGDTDVAKTVSKVIATQLKTGVDMSNAVNTATTQVLDAIAQAVGVELETAKEAVSNETVDEDNQKTIKIEINQ